MRGHVNGDFVVSAVYFCTTACRQRTLRSEGSISVHASAAVGLFVDRYSPEAVARTFDRTHVQGRSLPVQGCTVPVCCIDGVDSWMRKASSDHVSSAPAGYRFPREVIAVAVRWYLRYGLPTATSRSCSPSAASQWITRRSTGGSRSSRRSSSMPLARLGTSLATDGSSMRPTSRWQAAEPICTGRSISTARSSTSWSQRDATVLLRERSSPGRSPSALLRSRSPRTGRRSTRGD
jgi:hypothetical protein